MHFFKYSRKCSGSGGPKQCKSVHRRVSTDAARVSLNVFDREFSAGDSTLNLNVACGYRGAKNP